MGIEGGSVEGLPMAEPPAMLEGRRSSRGGAPLQFRGPDRSQDSLDRSCHTRATARIRVRLLLHSLRLAGAHPRTPLGSRHATLGRRTVNMMLHERDRWSSTRLECCRLYLRVTDSDARPARGHTLIRQRCSLCPGRLGPGRQGLLTAVTSPPADSSTGSIVRPAGTSSTRCPADSNDGGSTNGSSMVGRLATPPVPAARGTADRHRQQQAVTCRTSRWPDSRLRCGDVWVSLRLWPPPASSCLAPGRAPAGGAATHRRTGAACCAGAWP